VTTIRTYTDHIKAGLVASYLRDKNIDVVLLNENGNLSYMPVSICLQVPETQVAEARFHLDGIASRHTEQNSHDDKDLSLAARIFLGALLLIGFGWIIASLFK